MKPNKKKLLIAVVVIISIFISSIIITYYCKITHEKINVNDLVKNVPASRLPNNLKPFLYEVVFKIARDSFSGRVNISFVCLKPTKIVVLNVKELTIANESINIYSQNETVYIIKHLINNEAETMTIFLYKDCFQNVNYSLFISFKGSINENLNGFYKSSYSESKNNIGSNLTKK